MDRGGVADHRRRLLAGLRGRVVEVGAGNGLNFAHYPPEVTSVLAVEPESYLRQAAELSAASAAVRIDVVDGVAEGLPADDATCDAVVASMVLCSVPDERAALLEMHRVLKPGGELRFFEHVRAQTPGLRRAQHVADATVWPLLFGGCHTSRDTAAEIGSAGFRVEWVERLRFPDSNVPVLTAPHVLGVARREDAG